MNKKGRSAPARIIAILVLIILVLLIIIVYSFIIKPKINAYVVKKQVEARDTVLGTILLQIQQKGFVQINLNETDSLYLIPVSQEQLAQAQANQQAINQKTQ